MIMEDKKSTWDLIKSNQFEAACIAADKEYEVSKSILPLRNKIKALFHLRQYKDAADLGYSIIRIDDGQTDSDFINTGIACWFLGEYKEGLDLWQRGESSPYSDAAGGVQLQCILYFASVKLNDEQLKRVTIKKLNKLLKSKEAVNWPAPLGAYLLEKIDEGSLLSYVSDIEVLKQRNLSQAYFVLALKALERGENEFHNQYLQKCVELGPKAYLESMYYMAKAELAK